MSIPELTPEQIRTMTLIEKDEWWLKNVYKGHMPQLTLRSAITGILLGGILSLTNLYIGIRTGWTLGVGISSVIISFAMFKLLAKLKIGQPMSVLENNAMQSIATSAGYMTAPLMASLPAYMMVTGNVIPMWQSICWIIVLAILGVLFAFPLKKRFINEEQLPFPEGYAAGVVLDSLHSDDAREGLFKAKILGFGALLSALLETLRNHSVMDKMKLGFAKIPETWDSFIYDFATPKFFGTPLRDLTIQFDSSIVMFGTGGLINLKTGASIFLGACINYMILAPWMIHDGVIPKATFKDIAMWSLWAGAAMMTTSSLYAFFSKPKMLSEAFGRLLSQVKSTRLKVPRGTTPGAREKDPLSEIELPLWISWVGIPLVGGLTVWLGHSWFGVHYGLGLIAIPLVFIFTLIAVTSTGLTGITPGSALGKLTQISFGVLAPGDTKTNLMTAGITSEVSLNASNLLMDIKPAYMLGGKPRHQAMGHILGIFAGALVAVPVFYFIFQNQISAFGTDRLPLPAAMIWRGVADVLSHGISNLHFTAQWAALIGAILGIVFEITDQKMKGKFWLSGVGVGLGFVLRFSDSWAMALGAFFFWACQRYCKDPKQLGRRIFVDNQETLSAGIIAGGSIIGIVLILIEAL